MRRCVCPFESSLTLHRCGSHNQAAKCGKSDANESLYCSLEVCLADVVVLQLQNDFPLFDKLTDILIETSTLLVESTDSSVSCIETIS